MQRRVAASKFALERVETKRRQFAADLERWKAVTLGTNLD